MRFVQIFALLAEKCLIYSTLTEIRIFLKQPKILKKPNKQISKKLNCLLWARKFSHFPQFWPNKEPSLIN